MSDRIIRLGKKWEADHLLWEEREKQKEVEMKLKEMEMLSSDKNYFAHLESVNGRVNLENKFEKTELNMVAFLMKERQLMLNRLKPKEKEFKPFTKDIRVVDAKFVSISNFQFKLFTLNTKSNKLICLYLDDG